MSTEATARFFTDLAEDEDLRKRYWESVERATVAATVELAAGGGYEFTEDELRAELESRATELSEEQLDAVAGGAEPLLAEGGRPDPRSRFLGSLARITRGKF